MKEEWRDVVGYEGMYIVSNLGNVMSIPRTVNGHYCRYTVPGYMLTKHVDKKGYLRVDLSKNNQGSSIKVHRLVAMAFIPNESNKPQINHIDGNKKNNHVDNLEWCTNGENQIHAYAHGLNHHAETSGRKKVEVQMIDPLTGKIVDEFRSYAEAEKTTGICSQNIRKVILGERQLAGGYEWKRGDAK